MTAATGYLRPDGQKGIRNVVVVAYLVECAHHVARNISTPFGQRAHLIGFAGCFPNAYALKMMKRLCTHSNVGAVLLVSLGCEGFDRHSLARTIRESGRHVETLVIQETGGTTTTIEQGRAWVGRALRQIDDVPRVPIGIEDLIIGTNCGGSDATSILTANPAIGRAFDRLAARGARLMFHETPELIGCEQFLARRATSPQLAEALVATVRKGAEYHRVLGHGSFSPGNADGGLTTMEEKSLGAYSKSGSSPIVGMLKPGDIPTRPGLYLMDEVPDGPVRWGFPGLSDVSGINEMIACGCHMNLFATGRGSVVGSAISPVIKVCANPETYRRMSADMDINAGRILESEATLDDVADEIVEAVIATASGQPTVSEKLGHQEFVLAYKSFEPLGPSCFPT
ncbi:UxaA family hydrolase [Fontivita pretiosa]|uniref:UxaA family hydrolase n=1 Tax=Fontivita pretiosa TaxID=2989684 RepID=UPI003D167596